MAKRNVTTAQLIDEALEEDSESEPANAFFLEKLDFLAAELERNQQVTQELYAKVYQVK